jgi:hypothetical protein
VRAGPWETTGRFSFRSALGTHGHALQLCHQAVNLDAVNPEIHFTAATVLEASRDLVNAIDAYRHVLRLRPGFLPALVNSAACLADLGELPESLEPTRRRSRPMRVRWWCATTSPGC